MDMKYHETISKMEKMNVNKEYIQGWIGGYLDNPLREEQRVNEAYEAGYEDGKSQNADNFSSWVVS